jgi:excisionase family DNA binding protein
MTDPIVAALLDRLLPEMEARVEAMVERKLAVVAVPQPDPWMTTLEAAQYLRLSPEALRARVRRGTIPAHRDGHRLLFHRDELDQHVGWHSDRNGRYSAARQLTNGPARLEPPGPWLQGGTP